MENKNYIKAMTPLAFARDMWLYQRNDENQQQQETITFPSDDDAKSFQTFVSQILDDFVQEMITELSRERQSPFSFFHRSNKRKCVSPTIGRIDCSCDFVNSFGYKHNGECSVCNLSSRNANQLTSSATETAKEATTETAKETTTETKPNISTKWITIKQLSTELKNDLRVYYIGLVNKYFPDQLFYIKNIDEIAWVADDLHARQIIEFVKTAQNLFNVLLPVYILQKE